jgi:hypothetical protein
VICHGEQRERKKVLVTVIVANQLCSTGNKAVQEMIVVHSEDDDVKTQLRSGGCGNIEFYVTSDVQETPRPYRARFVSETSNAGRD